MALVGRIFVVIFSFLLACVAAALVMVVAVTLPGWRELLDDPTGYHVVAVTVAFSAMIFSIDGLLPAMLVIAIAEGFRLRSVLFYALAGGALALAGGYGWNFAAPGFVPDDPLRDTREALAAAGIVGGFVYWTLAGRNAGRWRV